MRTLLFAILALTLVGCSDAGDPPATRSSAEVIEQYQPLFDGVSAAVQEGYPGPIYETDNVHELVDSNGCGLWIGNLENATTDMDDREDYLAIIAPLLEQAGLPELTELETGQGVRYAPTYVSEDEAGTQVRVHFDAPGFSFSITSDVTDDPCGD